MVSWKCTTMARVSTLEETLFSFLSQDDLSNCEMVIVNDYPLQTLEFHHPKVRIFNCEPFKTIGDKENFAVEQCKGDIIAVTDDDDIYLPRHNTNINKYFIPGTNMLHWQTGIYYNEPNITAITGIGNSGMVYTKEVWNKVGKHPIMNEGGDSSFSRKVHDLGNIVNAEMPVIEASAFYCWARTGRDGVGVYHQSGLGSEEIGRPNIIQRHGEYIERLRYEGKIPTGKIQLKPSWKYDYSQLLVNFVKNIESGRK